MNCKDVFTVEFGEEETEYSWDEIKNMFVQPRLGVMRQIVSGTQNPRPRKHSRVDDGPVKEMILNFDDWRKEINLEILQVVV